MPAPPPVSWPVPRHSARVCASLGTPSRCSPAWREPSQNGRGEMKNCVWVKPELVAQIEFGEWTPDGHLRHSRFVGLREDKDPREVVREG